MLELSAPQMSRLALVRYLLWQSREQSDLPQPKCALAILPLHDALEMFLDLLSEATEARGGKSLLDYWKNIAEAKWPVALPYFPQMDKFNKARVLLKHHGQRSSQDQVKEHYVNCLKFLEEVSIAVFGKSVSQASMSSLITHENVRNYIQEAESYHGHINLDTHYQSIAKAFDLALRALLIPPGKKIFRNLDLEYPTFDMQLDKSSKRLIDKVIKPINKKINVVVDQVNHVSDYTTMNFALLSFGINLNDYRKFCRSTPRIVHLVGGSSICQTVNGLDGTVEDLSWCIEFTIDFILRLEANTTSFELLSSAVR